MSLPRAAAASVDVLPMFLTEEQRALGARLGSAAAEAPWDTLAAKEMVPWLARAGFLRLLVPDSGDDGGDPRAPGGAARLSVRALCVAREALAYHSATADSIFAVQGLGSHSLTLTPGAVHRDDALRNVRNGTDTWAFALTEPDAGSDVASLRTTAREDGDGFVLDGAKTFISNAGIATHYCVFANARPELGKKGISAFVVPAGAPGLRIEAQRAGGDHPLGAVLFSGVRVPRTALVGDVGQGLRLALGTLDVFRTSVGAAALGLARRAFDEAVARVRSRRQFGQRLVDFQLTQGALAEMALDLEAARLLVYRAAWEKDAGPTDGRVAVALAKLGATEAASRIIDRAVQLAGGQGVLEGGIFERLYREVRPLRIYEGTSEIQKLIVGQSFAAPG